MKENQDQLLSKAHEIFTRNGFSEEQIRSLDQLIMANLEILIKYLAIVDKKDSFPVFDELVNTLNSDVILRIIRHRLEVLEKLSLAEKIIDELINAFEALKGLYEPASKTLVTDIIEEVKLSYPEITFNILTKGEFNEQYEDLLIDEEENSRHRYASNGTIKILYLNNNIFIITDYQH